MALEASNDQKLAAIQETGKKAAENLKKQAVDFDNDTTEGKGDIPTDLTKLIEISKPGSTTENIEDEEKQLIRQAIDQAIKDTTNEYAAKIPGLTEMHVRAWIFNETIKNDLEKLPAEIALEDIMMVRDKL